MPNMLLVLAAFLVAIRIDLARVYTVQCIMYLHFGNTSKNYIYSKPEI